MLINIDEVATGALVNALAVAGRRLSVAIGSMPRRRREHDLTVARWFGTYELTRQPPGLPLPAHLADALSGDEVQAALQELLAARLTDAPETAAARAREVLSLGLGQTAEAAALIGYYDDEICTLVARLEADDPPLLAQIRSDSFNTRIVAVLNAIERHTAALSARPSYRTEADFLARYRGHVTEQHGKLEPPDFDRRRRVPISDIYVPTIITKDLSSERTVVSHPSPESLDVWRLAGLLDRTVLLGDPGGGKTTAANVLMNYFGRGDRRVPFLVTLREYAAKDPPERSVAGHIEHILETFYQSPAPPGVLDLLLLTGRAVVIFDGLDELLDTSRRADVTARVEHFCAEYPLTPVLVTSRVIGYEQARLDPGQFTAYLLGGFEDEQVAEYARKWFTADPDARPDDAGTFLAESASVPDLRSNPLMLALLCILYRGEGSLPRNRAEVYEQCANLLFRKWDARRRIHQNLRAGHLLEPTLRHLAWWMFTHSDAKAAVTEHELIAETALFLHGRGFESEHDARVAAGEFVEFCRGRMWVFTDAGTTASGEKLYAFTHRTFLEYFTAAQLAYDYDSPEQLAIAIVGLLASKWWTVCELALQIKDRTSNAGAQRIYGTMLAGRSATGTDQAEVLRFLATGLQLCDPSPQRVRELTRCVLKELIGAETAGGDDGYAAAAGELVIGCGSYREIVADEASSVITEAIQSGDRAGLVTGVLIVCSASFVALDPFWESWRDNLLRAHPAAVAVAAEDEPFVRGCALELGIVTVGQALAMPEGFGSLFRETLGLFGGPGQEPYFVDSSLRSASDFEAVGQYLMTRGQAPWLDGDTDAWLWWPGIRAAPPALTGSAYLGAVAVMLVICELTDQYAGVSPDPQNVSLSELRPYLACRRDRGVAGAALPELRVPDEFKRLFLDWAERRVNLCAPRREGNVTS